MTDVFLSYANEDRDAAERLAALLADTGRTVWWDRNIAAGQVFEDVIESAIDAAGCVVVLWSRASVKSRWVRSEANEGVERDALVPVRLDDCRIPLQFRAIHTVDFGGWDGAPGSAPFRRLVESIERLVAAPPTAAAGNVVSMASHRLDVQWFPDGTGDPPDVDAIVAEQDTALVLGPSDRIRDYGESVESLTRQIANAGESPQGSIVVLNTVPKRFLAIVHDLDREPSCTEESVTQSVRRVLELATERGFRSIAMPLLGTVHGNLTNTRAREILDEATARAPRGSLRRIWLMRSDDD